jgi:hypothetical protein
MHNAIHVVQIWYTVHFLEFPTLEFPIFRATFQQFPILFYENSSSFQKIIVIIETVS